MKRMALMKHLAAHGCRLEREGANHSIVKNEATGKRTSVPRHTEILDLTCAKICKQLVIPKP